LSGEKTFDGLGEKIELEVEEGAGLEGVEVGDLEGMGNEPDGEAGIIDLRDRKGDTVDSDGALVDDVLEEFGGRFDAEEEVLAASLGVGDGTGGVDVAGDEVAPDFAIEAEGALEIDGIAGLDGLEGGQADGFVEEVEGDGLMVKGNGGKAAAIDSDGIAHLEVLEDGLGGEFEAVGGLGFGKFENGAGFFNNSGKHTLMLRDGRRKMPA